MARRRPRPRLTDEQLERRDDRRRTARTAFDLTLRIWVEMDNAFKLSHAAPSCYADAAYAWRLALYYEHQAKTPSNGRIVRMDRRQRGRSY